MPHSVNNNFIISLEQKQIENCLANLPVCHVYGPWQKVYDLLYLLISNY